MRIVNARTGGLQEIPFALGESGRGRHREEVRLSNRPGQEPGGPEDVGYVQFGEGHVLLTKSDRAQRGILLRINTAGAYTKGSCGQVVLKHGQAKLLAQGIWAEGDAGRVANGPDQLWHVEGPALFTVHLQGGERKGMGWRYLFVTASFKVVMKKRDELCQLIATDDDPEVVAVIRGMDLGKVAAEIAAAQAEMERLNTLPHEERWSDVGREAYDRARAALEAAEARDLHADIKSALALADRLEEATGAPMAPVAHFVRQGGDIRQIIAGWSVAIPASFNAGIGRVAGIESGTLVPGEKQLVSLRVGPGGGVRYGFTVVAETGVTVLRRERNHKGTEENIIALVETPDWAVAWTERCDGEVTNYMVANAGGVHSYDPISTTVETRPWEDHEANPITQAEIQETFGLGSGPLFPEWVQKWAAAAVELFGATATGLFSSLDGSGRSCSAVEERIQQALWRLPSAKADALQGQLPSLFRGKGVPTFEANAELVRQAIAVRLTSTPSTVEAATPASTTPSAQFKDEGKRWFRCSCGATVQVSKGDWQAYQAGAELTLTCSSGCGGSGTVKK